VNENSCTKLVTSFGKYCQSIRAGLKQIRKRQIGDQYYLRSGRDLSKEEHAVQGAIRGTNSLKNHQIILIGLVFLQNIELRTATWSKFNSRILSFFLQNCPAHIVLKAFIYFFNS